MKKNIWMMTAIMGIVLAGVVQADVFTWTATSSGNWDDGGNWTLVSGSSGRTYPNNSADTADITNNISSDVVITIPAAGITVGVTKVGDADASHMLSFTGSGSITFSGGADPFNVINGATVQLDVPTAFGSNARILNGAGLLIINQPISNSSFLRFQPTGLTVRMNAEFQGIASGKLQFYGCPLQVGMTGSLLSNTEFLDMYGAGPMSAYGQDRTIDDRVRLSHSAYGEVLVDGMNTLEITGEAILVGRAGRDFGMIIDTATLHLSGDVTWTLTNDKLTDLGDRPDGPELVNNATLLISGSGNTYTDSTGAGVNIEGTGTFMVNNQTGSVTGTGNTNWIASGVTLAGNGSIAGSTLILRGGTIAPGTNAVGTLAVGPATFETGSTYAWENSKDEVDLLTVSGNLTIADNFTIAITELNQGIGASDIITYTGAFSGTPSAWTINGPAGYESVTVEDTGSAIRLTGLPAAPTGTVIIIK